MCRNYVFFGGGIFDSLMNWTFPIPPPPRKETARKSTPMLCGTHVQYLTQAGIILDKMLFQEVYVQDGVRTIIPLITSQEHKPVHHSAPTCKLHLNFNHKLNFIPILKGKFSSGIEGALASTLNRDFNWKQLSDMILCVFCDVFKVYLSNIDLETAEIFIN